MSWAEIKAALNSTLGTDDFLPLDQLFGGYVEFTENGTFTVPPKVTEIWITACAGGGGGSSYSATGASRVGCGGGGGDAIENRKFTVTPGQEISITVGTGGAGGYNTGGTGGNTIIGSLITLTGGGGAGNTTGGVAGGAGGGRGGRVDYNGEPGLRGHGGYAGNQSPAVYKMLFSDAPNSVGGGGGGSLGIGGSSLYTDNSINDPAVLWRSTPGKYGGGGAGGISNSYSAGGGGIVCIGWGPLGRAALVARNFD